MKLTVLGSGCNELRKNRSSPAYLVDVADSLMMLDAGQGALRRILDSGHDPRMLHSLILSHHHPDHIADLIPLLFSLKYDQHMAEKEDPLNIYAHKGMEGFLAGLVNIFGQWLTPEKEKIRKCFMNPGDELKTEKGISLSCFQMDHLSTSLAWSIEYSGKKLVYLGDGPDSPGLADFCMDADLLLVHCAGSDENPKPGHMFPAMAGKLAGRSKVKKLLLSHFYRMVEPDLAIKGAARYFSGSIIAAIDLLCLEF